MTKIKRGIYFDGERNKWRARIKIDGRFRHLGWFDQQADAQFAYSDFLMRMLGTEDGTMDYRTLSDDQAFARVLAYLRNARDQIDRTISMLETLKSGSSPVVPQPASPVTPTIGNDLNIPRTS